MSVERACVISWPKDEEDDAAWDRAYEEYARALTVRDDRYQADIDRMTVKPGKGD